jgi:hypothetical protein
VFGIYHTQREHGGILLFVGIIVLVLGLMLEMAGLTWDTFIWPLLCANESYISFVREGVFINSMPFMFFFISLISFLLLGTVITALGLLKTKRFGKMIPVLLISGILLYVIGNFLLFYLALLGLCLYSCAFILIGNRIWKNPEQSL